MLTPEIQLFVFGTARTEFTGSHATLPGFLALE
jgi:hypothetical protein